MPTKNPNNSIASNLEWFAATTQIPDGLPPSPRQVAFYTGMQLEELAEKLGEILSDQHPFVQAMDAMGEAFKSGARDVAVTEALADPQRSHDMFDADLDILWVTLGGAKAASNNVLGGHQAVCAANWRKEWPDGTFHLDKNGKVTKPEGWAKPDLKPFMYNYKAR